ncbi:MAG TPA: sigma-54 dependent transcriptional regulator [Haliangiales bacterium]|nr:sigma-54 dependent transcriptional regulator [Haliangiales bacterium]
MATDRALVLVVDDDEAVAKVLMALLGQAGFDAAHAPSGETALTILADRPVDLVVSDVRMPGMGGLALLAEARRRWPEVPVILLTAHGSVPLAVEAMKAGAADFILKPFDREEVMYAVRKALAAAGSSSPPGPSGESPFVGASPALRAVTERIVKVARGSSTVLIRGESGTGKELAARAIHRESRRADGPFVAVHCGALPEPLLESELFGYEKGAFTGATQRKPGRLELAAGGTLFLDEIGDVPPAVQVKLLRVLQEKQVERLGATKTLSVDVRFIAATHRDLEAMVAAGTFREDLLYRLNVVPVRIPSLRERPEDIEQLASHFCATFAAQNGKPGLVLEPGAVAALAALPWPGNVRQLQNALERLVVLSDRATIAAADVARELGGASTPAPPGDTLDDRRREAERAALANALVHTGGNRTVAARVLGVSRRTLYYKLKEHGLA